MRTRLPRLWRAARPTWWPDVALVVVLGIAVVWVTVTTSDATTLAPRGDTGMDGRVVRDWHQISWDVVLNLATTTALIGRRRWPLACFAAQFVVVLALDPNGNVVTLTALLIGAYSVAVHSRSAPLALGVLLATGLVVALVESNTWPRMPGWVGVFALLMPVGLAGVAIRAARGRADASDQRAEALRREQTAVTGLAVAQERARIARELHDVVSHHVSVMTIQAGAAGKVLDTEPELARGALSAIETSGRATMAELRHLLGVLAPEPSDDLLHPQPGLAQLDALVDGVRRAGQPLTVRRSPGHLPHGSDLTAYRVVQEALTNALRHAPGAPTSVAIDTGPDGLVIEVTNDAPPDGGPPVAGTGTGLLGLAERLRLYGGTLESGRRVGGGFRLRARLPLDDDGAADPRPPGVTP